MPLIGSRTFIATRKKRCIMVNFYTSPNEEYSTIGIPRWVERKPLKRKMSLILPWWINNLVHFHNFYQGGVRDKPCGPLKWSDTIRGVDNELLKELKECDEIVTTLSNKRLGSRDSWCMLIIPNHGVIFLHLGKEFPDGFVYIHEKEILDNTTYEEDVNDIITDFRNKEDSETIKSKVNKLYSDIVGVLI